MNAERWSADEDDYIRTHPDLTIRQLADALGRTYDATKLRRYKLLGSHERALMVKPSDQQHMDRWRRAEGAR